jgi:NAD(P)-dependent dehydrogenase (short-subunit alcohol dehydrogenase family)
VDLAGTVSVVTGASAGIGRATALAFASLGSTVVVAARREDRLAGLVAEIESRGGRAVAMGCDVTEREQLEALAGRVGAELGGCDVLVNNAGIPGGGPFLELSVQQIERVVRTNYLGVVWGTRAFLPMMVRAGRGHVVNVASLAGRFAVPGSSVYSSAKHAVVAFSESLHFEVAPRGVLVTTVNPGLVRTEGFPHRDRRRVMGPERVAATIVEAVERGKAPEVSVPRWLAAMQVVRLVAPPLYRFGLGQAARRGLRPTRAGQA